MDQPADEIDDELSGTPTPDPAVPGEGTPRGMSKTRKWITALVGTAAVGVAAIVGVNIAGSGTQNQDAAGPAGVGGPGGAGRFDGRGGGNAGTIASIGGSTIKMTTQDGTSVNVTTSASTTVSLSTTGALTDVRVGDNVRVVGTTSGTSVAADAITDSGTSPLANVPGGGGGFGGAPTGAPPNGAGPPNGGGARPQGGGGGPGGGLPPAGVVKTVNGTTFTVATADGSTVTVNASPSTTVTLVKPGTLGSLKVGDQIQVTGTGTDGTIAATNIRAGALGGPRN